MPHDPTAVLHEGERAAQQRFATAEAGAAMSRMIRDRLSTGMIRFIEAQGFFFIATASRDGACDCSFRGAEQGPAIRAIDDQTLIFPDVPGNNLFNSLGNILVNPHIGLLFVDFARPARLRVNGCATIIEDGDAFHHLWPAAPRAVRVSVTQAFPNCARPIPRLLPAPPSLTESEHDDEAL